jgi:aryl-alcohol dehydrogenase-like predicted oxidoreductase
MRSAASWRRNSSRSCARTASGTTHTGKQTLTHIEAPNIQSPTAGGLLTDRVAGSGGKELPSRTASNPRGAERFKERYGKPEILDSLLKLHATCAKEGSTVQGASLRWLAYHSKLGAEDAVILGASKVEQVDDSAAEIAKGPLKEDIVGQFEQVWQSVKDVAPVGYSD